MNAVVITPNNWVSYAQKQEAIATCSVNKKQRSFLDSVFDHLSATCLDLNYLLEYNCQRHKTLGS